jgi:hypothetical protein
MPATLKEKNTKREKRDVAILAALDDGMGVEPISDKLVPSLFMILGMACRAPVPQES